MSSIASECFFFLVMNHSGLGLKTTFVHILYRLADLGDLPSVSLKHNRPRYQFRAPSPRSLQPPYQLVMTMYLPALFYNITFTTFVLDWLMSVRDVVGSLSFCTPLDYGCIIDRCCLSLPQSTNTGSNLIISLMITKDYTGWGLLLSHMLFLLARRPCLPCPNSASSLYYCRL